MAGETYEFLLPSVVLGETHFHAYGEPLVISAAAERAAAEGFFTSFEIPDVPDKVDRKRVGKLVSEGTPRITQWMSMVLTYANAEGLNLSSMDDAVRGRTVSRVKSLIDPALECGATHIGLLSGPDPGPSKRPAAMEQLRMSLCELCHATKDAQLNLVLEPLDRDIHKKCLVGPTEEAVRLVEKVREDYPNLSLCWDYSHVVLNGENPVVSLERMMPYITHVHFANPVLDPTSDLYGDHHIPMGEPGVLTMEKLVPLLRHVANTASRRQSSISVALEIRSERGGSPWGTVVSVEKTLRHAFRHIQEGDGPY